MSFDFDASAKFGLLYIPESPIVPDVIAHYLGNIDVLLNVGKDLIVEHGHAGTDERIGSGDLLFTRRVTAYTPYRFSSAEKGVLMELAASKDIRLVLRDGAYLAERTKNERPQAFISHDSRDKEPFVRELAVTLQKMYCTVWYDDFSLVAGSSLRGSIEKGLRECHKCVLILSPHFISNGGWTKVEFDSVFTREILEQRNVIIPIWHGVSKTQVYEYSPRLLDKVGVPSSLGVEEVARKVLHAVNSAA